MNHPAVQEHDGARGPAHVDRRARGQRRGVARGEGAGPAAVVVELIEDRPAVRARNGRERALLGTGVVEIDAEGEHAEARVGPGLDVLMPAYGVAAVRPLEVELRAVEPDVWPEQVGDEVDHGRVLGERPELRMLVDGLAESPDVRLLGGVIGCEIELIVRGCEGSRLLDLGIDYRAQ